MQKRTIPEIRNELHQEAQKILLLANMLTRRPRNADTTINVADQLCDLARKVQGLADETFRRPPVRKARPKARHVTPQLRQEIKVFALGNPLMSMRDIGKVFGVDGGRVSEAVAGFRGE